MYVYICEADVCRGVIIIIIIISITVIIADYGPEKLQNVPLTWRDELTTTQAWIRPAGRLHDFTLAGSSFSLDDWTQ